MEHGKNWEKLRLKAMLFLIAVLDPLSLASMHLTAGVEVNMFYLLPTSIVALVFLFNSGNRNLFRHVPKLILAAGIVSHINILSIAHNANYSAYLCSVIVVNCACYFLGQGGFRYCVGFAIAACVIDPIYLILKDGFPFAISSYMHTITTLFIVEGVIMWIYFGYQQKMGLIRTILVEQVGSERQTSHVLLKTSDRLDQTVQSQSGALQETTASVDEIKSIAEHNLGQLREANKIMESFFETIREAASSRTEIENSLSSVTIEIDKLHGVVEDNKAKFEELSKVLQEISNITKMVNDIVFQTKLLSFNASVEATRAGDEGKGFSVVAEEVGVLAQSSGKAATDISRIVNESLSLFDSVKDELSSKMDAAQSNVSKHIEVVSANVRRNSEILDKVSDKSSEVKDINSSVIRAITEIDTGLAQIVEAMRILNSDNDHILNSTEDTKGSVTNINSQVRRSEELMEDLKPMVSPFDEAA
ncbi:methyl-accepting chemotaxis protein [Pseudobacteriovorax antillogorgiicola]|uniref:Methyl-accepting chemotaxis protein n=1 Tax=Pseudobacteriovorax antillogorgiicola TaxID=1513793 RepID=A0A1Y6CG78_9BACT|nr:methyl-accepting chemotaxis protein [Pseudobacteriovorax antillogorgiicola]TCS47347.1 methyl-accepting chemotaxis protein [Pseudobacteriovorax antillogorgiicola]SMF63214.1 Methyl-accepting chemotaxis protein [Pseudobacteriovorax antillogorgiicola]